MVQGIPARAGHRTHAPKAAPHFRREPAFFSPFFAGLHGLAAPRPVC